MNFILAFSARCAVVDFLPSYGDTRCFLEGSSLLDFTETIVFTKTVAVTDPVVFTELLYSCYGFMNYDL